MYLNIHDRCEFNVHDLDKSGDDYSLEDIIFTIAYTAVGSLPNL